MHTTYIYTFLFSNLVLEISYFLSILLRVFEFIVNHLFYFCNCAINKKKLLNEVEKCVLLLVRILLSG